MFAVNNKKRTECRVITFGNSYQNQNTDKQRKYAITDIIPILNFWITFKIGHQVQKKNLTDQY